MQIDAAQERLLHSAQVQVHDNSGAESVIYRGRIQTVQIEDGHLKVWFDWLARTVKPTDSDPLGWEYVNPFAIDLVINEVRILEGGMNSLCVASYGTGRVMFFYPSDGSTLEPSRIRGVMPPEPVPVIN